MTGFFRKADNRDVKERYPTPEQQYLELPHGILSHDTIQRVFFILRSDELQSMLVNILKQIVTAAGKRLDESLYKNEELDCYIRDVIAADGKETHNTGKKSSEDPTQRRNLNEFNVMSTQWGISLYQAYRGTVRNRCTQSLAYREWPALGA